VKASRACVFIRETDATDFACVWCACCRMCTVLMSSALTRPAPAVKGGGIERQKRNDRGRGSVLGCAGSGRRGGALASVATNECSSSRVQAHPARRRRPPPAAVLPWPATPATAPGALLPSVAMGCKGGKVRSSQGQPSASLRPGRECAASGHALASEASLRCLAKADSQIRPTAGVQCAGMA
jgi:hypothetical protein